MQNRMRKEECESLQLPSSSDHFIIMAGEQIVLQTTEGMTMNFKEVKTKEKGRKKDHLCDRHVQLLFGSKIKPPPPPHPLQKEGKIDGEKRIGK